jgi:hypothetical protein
MDYSAAIVYTKTWRMSTKRQHIKWMYSLYQFIAAMCRRLYLCDDVLITACTSNSVHVGFTLDQSAVIIIRCRYVYDLITVMANIMCIMSMKILVWILVSGGSKEESNKGTYKLYSFSAIDLWHIDQIFWEIFSNYTTLRQKKSPCSFYANLSTRQHYYNVYVYIINVHTVDFHNLNYP